MNEGLLPKGILEPAGWDHTEPSWFDYSMYTWMAIDKLSINDLLIDNVLGTLPLESTPHEKPIDPQQSNLTCTPDSTKTKACMQLLAVDNDGGKAYGKATGLYNKHCKYLEQWNLCHLFRSVRLSTESVV